MIITAIISSIIAWFIGLLIDANIGFELELRILFPMLTMGGFILSKMKIKK